MIRSSSSWGEAETRFFYELTPDRILDAVEAVGLRCTGRCSPLASMENRVYEVELDLDEAPANPSERFRVVKFYRPGRWNEDQILEEHAFLRELVEEEIPVVAPLVLDGGSTLAKIEDPEIRYAVWPRIGGRAPDELTDEHAEQLGRLVARVHNVGARREAVARIRLDPQTYGRENLAHLLETGALPEAARDAYRRMVETICSLSDPWFAAAAYQRIHGDCHLGNVLWGREGAFLVDFDDMVRGPCVQDLWLLAPGNDDVARRLRDKLLAGYEQLRDFDRASLRLVEPLRALRIVHFSAWISRRWDDPAFKRVFHDFGTDRYWFDEVAVLQEQLALIQDRAWG